MACTMNTLCLLGEGIIWNNDACTRIFTGHEIKCKVVDKLYIVPFHPKPTHSFIAVA